MSPILHIGPDVPETAQHGMLLVGPMISVIFKDPISGRTSPPIDALVDTGSSITCLDEGFVAMLMIDGGKPSSMKVPLGQDQVVFEYELELLVSSIDETTRLKVLSAKLINQGIGALLGRDFLKDKVMIYNGRDGNVTICR